MGAIGHKIEHSNLQLVVQIVSTKVAATGGGKRHIVQLAVVGATQNINIRNFPMFQVEMRSVPENAHGADFRILTKLSA